MPKPDDPIAEEIKCECGKIDCNQGLLVRKYGDKVKLQIFEGEEIKSIVVNKEKLLERLK